MNIGSQTVYLSAGYTQVLSAYAPFELTIDPSISAPNKVYKISYDFGDGSSYNRILDLITGSPLKFTETHQYSLTGSEVKNIEINANIYTFNTDVVTNYKIFLTLQTKKMEVIESSAYYPTNGLLAYWSMNETAGDRLDSSPNGYNLIEQNGIVQSGVGKIGNAAIFNGIVYFSNPDFILPESTDFTITGWYKPTSRGFVEIIDQWNANAGQDGNFVITYDESDNGSLGFHIMSTVSESILYVPINLNEWTFFAMRWRDTLFLEVKINNGPWYRVDNSGSLLGKGGTNFLVGAGDNGSFVISGGLDEIGVWTVALPDSEIYKIYDTAANGSGFKELHLVGSRMFGPNDDILYFFESIEPNYILPVLVNWDNKPVPVPKITIPPNYRPFNLLSPFENEAVTSIDDGSHVYSAPDGEGKYLPDPGNINN
jgi:hypothetical protein